MNRLARRSRPVLVRHSMACVALLIFNMIASGDERIVKQEFVYDQVPFEQCHASTIEETDSGLVAAWFGGKEEKDPSVGIWLSRHDGQSWSQPVEVANGDQTSGNVARYACWNPVLFQPQAGPLLLFYKVGPNPREWWGMLMKSSDGGKTWSKPERLPNGILGPIRAKPIQLADGTILCGSSSEHDGWRVHFERTPDLGKTWTRTPAINTGSDFGIIQPTIFSEPDGSLRLLSEPSKEDRRNGLEGQGSDMVKAIGNRIAKSECGSRRRNAKERYARFDL